MNKIVTLIICSALSLSCYATTSLNTVEDTKKFSEQAFELLISEGAEKGISMLGTHSESISNQEINFLIKTRLDQKLHRVYGQILAISYLHSDTIGEDVVRHWFIEKREKYMIFWKLVYYRADKTWDLVNINYSDKAPFNAVEQ